MSWLTTAVWFLMFTILPATCHIDDFLKKNDEQLKDARNRGDQREVDFLLEQRQRQLDSYLQSARQQDARREAFLQEQRQWSERIRADSERHKAAFHAKESVKWKANAEIIRTHFGM